MKHILFFTSLILLNLQIRAQLYTPGTSIAGPTGNNNVGVGTSSPSGKLGIGNQEDVISTSGITLGADQSTIEFVGSNWASGYGHKIFAEDFGSGGIINLNIAGRANTGNWLNIITFQNQGNIGIGTTTPKTNLDLYTGYNGGRIASFGTRLGYNEWNGIHIGYSESENNYYRKAGIVFERIDVHARGKLHFINDIDEGNSSFDLSDSKMVISENGNVGIGTTNPFTKLMLVNMVGGVNTARIGFYGQSGDGGNNMDNGGVRFINDNSPYYSEVAGFRGVDSQQAGLHFYTASSSAPSIKMTITPTGEMGIGTETPGTYKLNVAGNIRANEIVVNTSGADFVFDPGYNLTDLEEIENYIEQNKHLPGIPSAETMQKDGMSMSEMQTTLLQKIEEITLYLIELKKENSELRNELEQLKGEKQ